MYIKLLRENLNSISCIKACTEYLYVEHAVNAAEYCKILHLKSQKKSNFIKEKNKTEAVQWTLCLFKIHVR